MKQAFHLQSMQSRLRFLATTLLSLVCLSSQLWASAHREAPIIIGDQSLNATDFYAFIVPESDKVSFVLSQGALNPVQDGTQVDLYDLDLDIFNTTAAPVFRTSPLPFSLDFKSVSLPEPVVTPTEIVLPVVQRAANNFDPGKYSLRPISRFDNSLLNEIVIGTGQKDVFAASSVRQGDIVRSFAVLADSTGPSFITSTADPRTGAQSTPTAALAPPDFPFFLPDEIQFGSDGTNIFGLGTSFDRGIFGYMFENNVLLPVLLNGISLPDTTPSAPRVAANSNLQLGAVIQSSNRFPFGNTLTAFPLKGGFPNGRRVADDVLDIAVRAMFGATSLVPNIAGQKSLAFDDEFPYAAVAYSSVADGKTYTRLLNDEAIPVTAPFAVLEAAEAFRSPTRNLFITFIPSRDSIVFGGVQGVNDSNAPLGFRDIGYAREFHLFENATGTSLNERRTGEENDVPFGIRDIALLQSGRLMYANPMGNGNMGQTDLQLLGLNVVAGTANLVNDPNLTMDLTNQVLRLDFTGDARFTTSPLPLGNRSKQIISLDFDMLVDQSFLDQAASAVVTFVFDDGDGIKETDGSDLVFPFELSSVGLAANKWFSFAAAYEAATGMAPEVPVPDGLSQDSWFLQFDFGAAGDPTVYIDNQLLSTRLIPEPGALVLALSLIPLAFHRGWQRQS